MEKYSPEGPRLASLNSLFKNHSRHLKSFAVELRVYRSVCPSLAPGFMCQPTRWV